MELDFKEVLARFGAATLENQILAEKVKELEKQIEEMKKPKEKGD